MSLSCSCDYDGYYDWYCIAPDDYEILSTKRRRRCSSCKTLIDIGAICTNWPRSREARDDVEIAIYGEGDIESIWLADYWMCETCSDLYFSLDELGFKCISPSENMRALVKEYAEVYAVR